MPRSSWAVSQAGGKLTVEDGRAAIAGLMMAGMRASSTGDRNIARRGFRPGFGGTNPGLVTAAGSTVTVQPFQLYYPTTRATGGAYIITQDTAFNFNGLTTPANATFTRIDRVIVQQNDIFYGDANSDCVIRQITGTPSSSPSVPAVDGSPDWFELARITVGPNQTNLGTTGTITDMRGSDLYTVASGGVLPVPDQAARDSLSNVYPGMTVFRRNMRRLETYVDSTLGWQPQRGVPFVSSLLSPGFTPEHGMAVVNSADLNVYVYNSSTAAWEQATFRQAPATTSSWLAPSSWTTGYRQRAGSPVGSRLIAPGYVALRGLVERTDGAGFTATGQPMFRLHAAHRPAESMLAPMALNITAQGAAGSVTILADGVVEANFNTGGGPTFMSMDGVTFPLDAF